MIGARGAARLLMLLTAPALTAADTHPLGIPMGPAQGAASLGVPMQIVLLLTALTLLPALVVSVTPFLRISVVLHFLRQALGTQSAPSNQVLIGLALFLTILLVQPVVQQVYEQAWLPWQEGRLAAAEAWERGSAPVRTFLLRYTREPDIRLFLELTRTAPPSKPSDLDLQILVPAYMISELRTAFQIGAVLFLPFLIIDIAVASVTLSIGMMQLPPVMVSAPFKILLFVLVDGWNLVIGSLFRSFHAS